ncbi:MAG: 2,3-bisphosphoglycerate-independent phosphoglycerate mutase [Candidatus Sumerlaeia bacterium]|nr:2,3-bisphosphoglycerate-independent phosphoglycerate mutase [Candidatus Sumerlaeia bacterium]
MASKIVLLVCDGLGDRPVPELGDKTPLEAARTPNLDRLAARGITGLMHSLGRGLTPGSDTSHLNILGYDYREYYSGRGTIEVAGLGMELRHGDVALRGNMGTVDSELKIVDRRAGRITDTSPFTQLLDGMEIEGVKFMVKPGTAHRAGIVVRGEGLSAKVTDNDPHEPGLKVWEVKPKDDSPEAARTAAVLNKFLARAHEVLNACEANKARVAEGKPAANYLLIRGAGFYRHVPPFAERYFGLKACCIAGGGLYKGIGAYTGMTLLDVPGATALPDSDIRAKFTKAREALSDFDFVFVHVKAADSLGEDGNWKGKRDFIERIDEAAELLLDLPDALLVVTADHTTPCALQKHSADPVPVMIVGDGVRVDGVMAYNERAVVGGGLGRLVGTDLMPELMNLIGKYKLIGA